MSQNPLSPRRRGNRGRVWVVATCVSVLGAAGAHAAVQTGGGLLKLNAIAEVTSDSNAFGNTSELDDIYFTLRPQIEFDREGSRGRTHLDAGVAIDRYNDFSELDTENWSANGLIEVPTGGGPLSGGLNFTFFDGAQADDLIGQRVDISRLNFALRSSYEVGSRTSVRFGAAFDRYDSNLLPEADSWSVRLGGAMRIRPQIDAFLDYTRGSTKSDEDPNVTFRSDYATDGINAGFEGQLSPTITGSISAGFAQYNARAGDTVGDSDNFVYNIRLTWKPRQGTDVTISGGQQNRIASNAQSLDTTLVRLNVRKRLAANWTASGDAEWETFSVRGASSTSDDRMAVALILEYAPSDRFGLGGGVRHNIRWSSNPNFDITRTTLNLYGRYTF